MSETGTPAYTSRRVTEPRHVNDDPSLPMWWVEEWENEAGETIRAINAPLFFKGANPCPKPQPSPSPK